MNITDSQADYVQSVVDQLRNAGIRAIADLRNEKIGFKIRERTMQRIPYMLVVGDREVETNTVSVRTRSGEELGSLSIADITKRIQQQINSRTLSLLED
jgi:threonyl-tRNA synthetase